MAIFVVGRLPIFLILRMTIVPLSMEVIILGLFVTTSIVIGVRLIPIPPLRLPTVVVIMFMHMWRWSAEVRGIVFCLLIRLSAYLRTAGRGAAVCAAETVSIGPVSRMSGPTSRVAARLLLIVAVRSV